MTPTPCPTPVPITNPVITSWQFVILMLGILLIAVIPLLKIKITYNK